ncbi:MAG: outer membrane protein transport protein [Pseudomonadota bacterium]|nr:outer membrane protein transport protein [Pseudomonadota bacterium]MDO7710706.1 outer membrane protein transport protein [Pseudomonadota bacterium]
MAQHYKLKLGSFLIASTLSSLSYASGFAIIEQSITGLGRAFAGSAAVADDASTIFFNPAGLTYLSHSEFSTGLNFIKPESDFNNEGSTLPSTLGGTAITGNGDNGGKLALVPNLYYAHRLNDRMVAGIGIVAPFGLVTDYDDNWVGRYHAVKSDLKTVNINPSFAFQTTEKLSLGFGINLQYADLELTQAVDFGAACASTAVSTNPAITTPLKELALECADPQAHDGKAKITADDWSWGYNLGLIFQATDATRIALAYRSKISHHLHGKGTFDIPDNGAVQTVANIAGFANGDTDGKVTLPETASFAVHHQINNKWAIMGDASWTRWSRFQDLTINSTDSVRLNSSKEEKWDNNMRYGLGLTYIHNDTWTFRGGIAYDQTPVSDQYRTPRIPDEDRKWLAIGASYKYSDNITLDAGYTHIFVSDPSVNDTDDNGYTLKGNYNASVDILGMQMRWLFL